MLLYNDLQKIQAPLMRIYSLFGGWSELQIPLKTQHLLYEIVLVISGLQKGFAMFLIQEEGGGVFFSLRFSFTKGVIIQYFVMLTFFTSEIFVT